MSTQTPLVSVAMITYGHEAFIKQAIEGVLMQECHFEVELIIANDGSPDNTDLVVKEIINNQPRAHWIKYTKHKANKGMMPNFIWALEQCQGKYIALCEGDDYWTDPSKLQKQVDFLEENEGYSMCFTHQLVVSKTGETIHRNEYENKVYNTSDIIKGFIPGTQTMVFRNIYCLTAMMKKFSSSPSGDRMLSYCFSFFGDLYLLPVFTAAYRQTGEGVWTSFSKSKQFIFSLEEFVKFHQLIGLPINNQIVHDKLNGAYPYLLKKDRKNFISLIRKVNSIKSKYNIQSQFLSYLLKKITPLR